MCNREKENYIEKKKKQNQGIAVSVEKRREG
jgi:hypothetical protein